MCIRDRYKASLTPIRENKPVNVVVDNFREQAVKRVYKDIQTVREPLGVVAKARYKFLRTY